MKYRIKVTKASSDVDVCSIVPDTVAQLHIVAYALRDAYPTHTLVVQRRVDGEWQDYRITDETGGFEL